MGRREAGRGLRVVQEAMPKLFAYAKGGGGARSNVERERMRCRKRRRRRRRRWNDDGGGRESATMVAMVTPRTPKEGKRRREGEREREKPPTQGLYFHNLPLCRF